MNAKNGFYGVRKKDTGITSIFIDEETLEFGQLQKMLSDNSRQAAKARQKKLEDAAAAAAKENAAARKARRRVKNLVKQEAKLAGGILVLLLAQALGLADWRFTIPTILALVAGMAFNVGRYVGREGGAKK